MECKIELEGDLKNFECFRDFLERRSKDYKSCIRDIKINTILGKKCIVNVRDLHPPIYCDFASDLDTSLSSAAISINNFQFTIDESYNIVSLSTDYHILGIENGEFVKKILSNGIELKIKPKARSNKITGFYIANERFLP